MPARFSSTLRQFLSSGQIGLLKLGTSRQTVLDTLGEPDSWSKLDEIGWQAAGQDRASTWYYGVLQIYFASNCIRRLVFYPADDKALPQNLNFTGYFPNHKTTLQAFTQHLEKEGMEYRIDERCATNKTCLLVEKTAYVMFDPETIISLAYPR